MVSFPQAVGSYFLLLLLSAPWWVRLVQVLVQASWLKGLVPGLWWVGLCLFPLMGRAALSHVFWGVCELSITLGSLSAKGWDCILVLLVVWHEVSSTGRQFGVARFWC